VEVTNKNSAAAIPASRISPPTLSEKIAKIGKNSPDPKAQTLSDIKSTLAIFVIKNYLLIPPGDFRPKHGNPLFFSKTIRAHTGALLQGRLFILSLHLQKKEA
jgi:hypothetical protein